MAAIGSAVQVAVDTAQWGSLLLVRPRHQSAVSLCVLTVAPISIVSGVCRRNKSVWPSRRGCAILLYHEQDDLTNVNPVSSCISSL